MNSKSLSKWICIYFGVLPNESKNLIPLLISFINYILTFQDDKDIESEVILLIYRYFIKYITNADKNVIDVVNMIKHSQFTKKLLCIPVDIGNSKFMNISEENKIKMTYNLNRNFETVKKPKYFTFDINDIYHSKK